SAEVEVEIPRRRVLELDGDAPVLLVEMAGRVKRDLSAGFTVTGGGASSHMEHASVEVGVDDDVTAEAFGSPVAGDEKFRWSGGDLQEGGIAPPVVELLTGRNGEAHSDRHRPGGDLGRRPLRRQSAFVDLLRILGQIHPGQRVGSGFNDEEFGLTRALCRARRGAGLARAFCYPA